MENLLMIVGVGRSGTSLLQSMFAAHPKVSFLPETAFLRKYVSNRSLQAVYENNGMDAVVELLNKDSTIQRLGIDISDLTQGLSHDELDPLDSNLYKRILGIGRDGAQWVGDKDPRSIEFLPTLASIKELGCHVVHIYRDPRDVLVSKMKAKWSRGRHPWEHIFAGKVQFLIGREDGPELFGQHYHEVCYERLLEHSEDTLTHLCDRMELSYDSSMLDFGDAARKLVSKEEESWKKETFGPLLTKNVGKWKEELSPEIAWLCELCCPVQFKAGSYPKSLERQKLSLFRKIWVLTGYVIISIATPLYLVKHRMKPS